MTEDMGQQQGLSRTDAVEVRAATSADAAAVGYLLRQLGYDASPEDAAERLGALSQTASDAVFVAATGDAAAVLGVIALHWTRMLQHGAPVARITTLVVDEQARDRGIGRLLVEAGMMAARAAGCGIIELTTALHREGAQAFYRSLGFEASSYRMHRQAE